MRPPNRHHSTILLGSFFIDFVILVLSAVLAIATAPPGAATSTGIVGRATAPLEARITVAPVKRDPEVSLWGQCSGYSRDWTAPAMCQSTATCVRYNDLYSESVKRFRSSDVKVRFLTLAGPSGWCSPLPDDGPWTTTRGQPCVGSANCMIATYVYSNSVWSCEYLYLQFPRPGMMRSDANIGFVAQCAVTSVFSSPSTSASHTLYP